VNKKPKNVTGNSKKMKNIILPILISLTSNITFAQNSEKIQLDSLFTTLYQKEMFNGNVLIADKGKIMFEKSYGLANEEAKQKLNTETIFELASVSKQFTAMGIVLLEKQGKLKYDDDISTYIPELDFYETITIRNLLNHTSGLPDYMELLEEKWDKSQFATNQDIVNELALYKPKLIFQPGEKYEYSNTGYALLALIIEKVSKKSFADFLNKNIFKPLEMNHTQVYRSRFEPKKIENYALGYVTDSTGNKVFLDSFGKEFYTYYLDGIVGDGMVNSTTEDLLKWDRALYTDKLVNSNDKQLIFGSAETKNGKETNYGFGWFIENTEKYGKIVNHSGGWAGYITYIERHLDNDKTIIILQNNSTELTSLPIKEVRRILYNEPLKTDNLKPATPTLEELDKYVGVYVNEEIPLTITVFRKESILMAQAEGQSAFPLDAYENNTFKFEPAQIKMIFNIEEKLMEFFQRDTNLRFTKKE